MVGNEVTPKPLILRPLRKVIKSKNATKTPRHQISQNTEYMSDSFGGILCFSAFVAR
jgi:hypothetical protein